MSILQDIYNNDYLPCEPMDELPPELHEKRWEFLGEIEKAMGKKFTEEHWENMVKILQFCEFTCFREGFRLGVAMMMEAR